MNSPFTNFSDFKRRYPIRPNDPAMLLGSGSYGKVVRVEDQLETEWIAIKISEVKGPDAKSLREEVKLAQRIPRQANIARYDACFRFETDTSLCDFALMKYYPDGNLAQLLRHQRPSESQIYELTRGILLGLQHLHQHRIVHRDFKPANILISRDNGGKLIPKIADFGLSKLVEDEEIDNSDFDLSDGRGTPSYKAPEQIEGSRVSFNLDLWAFGVILYEIMVGEKPFQVNLTAGSEQAVRRAIELKIMAVELPGKINQVAQPYQQLIRRCLVRDIHQRARKVTELLELLDNIPQLLADAQTLDNQQKYEQSRVIYEQILHLSPSNAAAIRGLGNCIEKSRPAPAPVVDEPTDAYVPTAARTPVSTPDDVPTDVFPPKVTTARAEPVATVPLPPAEKASASVPVHPKRQAWRYAVPAVAIVAGIGLYMTLSGKKPATASGGTPRDSAGTATPAVGVINNVPTGSGVAVTKAGTLPTNPPGLLRLAKLMTVRGAAAEARTMLAFYNKAAVGTPAEQRVALKYVRSLEATYAAGNLVTVTNPTPATATGAAPVSMSTAVTVATTPPAALPAETRPDPAAARLEAQQTYDQLIDKGVATIAGSNNKNAAIALFSEARQLADKQELNTAKGREKYAFYMAKAGRIMASDDYDGAKNWYLVAQALSNTADVKAKIKQCITQTASN